MVPPEMVVGPQASRGDTEETLGAFVGGPADGGVGVAEGLTARVGLGVFGALVGAEVTGAVAVELTWTVGVILEVETAVGDGVWVNAGGIAVAELVAVGLGKGVIV